MKATMWGAAAVIAAALTAGGCATQGGDPSGYLSSAESVSEVRIGKSTTKDVEQLFGKPASVVRDSRRGWDQWEYRVFQSGRRSTVWLSFSGDGVVREVVQLRDWERTGS